ncbi:hypothetical protein AC423_004687 [Salmonella enterica subsp. enterica]|nr:hypothetical protein [Salmonella enterica subsp. enterica]
MNGFWSSAIKVTGIPGLVLFLFYYLIDKILDEKLTTLLGVGRVYILIIIFLMLITIFFIFSLLKTINSHGKNSEDTSPSKQENKIDEAIVGSDVQKIQTIIYKDNAKHEGDNNFS